MAKLTKNPKKPKETKQQQLQPKIKEEEEEWCQLQQPQKLEKTHSWTSVRGLLTCKNLQPQQQVIVVNEAEKKSKKMRPSLSSSTDQRDHHRKRPSIILNNNSSAAIASSSSAPSLSASFNSSAAAAAGSSFRGSSSNRMPFRRFSGCYECKMVVDPVLGFTRDPSLRSTICTCPECGEIFMKPDNLELHQAVRHAVSELSPEDTSKNIVEIIFQSSWLKKQTPICKIDRILKVHNTQRTISKFEEYREQIKNKATKFPNKKHYPRCVADGNELLRFHCTTFSCSLGLNGSTNLCNSSVSRCNICNIVKNGFKVVEGGPGILTTATSGRAHDEAAAEVTGEYDRAMLVCRVIAGRVKKEQTAAVEAKEKKINMEDYDSVAGEVGMYSNLDELYVFNPKAILPCFVVIYRWF